MNLFIFLLLGLTIIGVLWWLLVTTEGVYLGRGVVIWLYDLYAQRYDHIKNTNATYEQAFTAHPIMARVSIADPLVLDVATGTGRLPAALLRHDEFAGQVIGIDLSRAMLVVAAQKLKPAMEHDHVLLIHGPAETLPLPDASVDIVTCLEALEFMMDDEVVLAELVRVLRAGGLLVITNRQGHDRYLMAGKVRSHEALSRRLQDKFGLVIDTINPKWSDIYGLIIATKPGHSPPIGTQAGLWQKLRCPRCESTPLRADFGYSVPTWVCPHCGHYIQQAFDGILEMRT